MLGYFYFAKARNAKTRLVKSEARIAERFSDIALVANASGTKIVPYNNMSIHHP